MNSGEKFFADDANGLAAAYFLGMCLSLARLAMSQIHHHRDTLSAQAAAAHPGKNTLNSFLYSGKHPCDLCKVVSIK